MEETDLINLEYLSILELNGKGSFELLQGQITADMGKVVDNECVMGAMCDIKGRVISSFLVTKNPKEDGGYFLIGDKEVMILTKDLLQKYQPFYDASLSIEDHYKFFAIKESFLLKEYPSTKLNQSFQDYGDFWRVHFLKKKFHIIAITESDKLQNYHASENIDPWILDEINNLNFEVSASTTSKFTPHELGYHITPRVDFEKGCYTGQEIVARMHYRAKKLPRMLIKASSDKKEILSKVLDDDKKVIGLVLLTAKEDKKNINLLSMNKNFSEQLFKF
jgi:folate-binding protein YgfZ